MQIMITAGPSSPTRVYQFTALSLVLSTVALIVPLMGLSVALYHAVVLKAAQEQNPDRPVVIQADKKMSYEEVMKVMDLLQRNNVNKVGLLVQSAQ